MRASPYGLLLLVFSACSGVKPISLVVEDASTTDIKTTVQPTSDTASLPVDTARVTDSLRPVDVSGSAKLDTAPPDLALPKDTLTKLDVMPAKLDTGVLIGNPTPNSWLLVVGDPETPEAGEKALIDHSKQRNQPLVPINARYFNSTDSSPTAAVNYVNGRMGVVISGSGSSSSIEAAKAFKNYSTPIIVLFDRAYNGSASSAWLTPATITTPSNRKAAGKAEGNQVQIAPTAGPLAAGLSGLVTVMPSGAPMFWGLPQSSEVIIVATLPEPAGAAAIFAYPMGAKMDDGSIAPAARAGFFFDPEEASALSADGYKLFDTLLDWAAAQ